MQSAKTLLPLANQPRPSSTSGHTISFMLAVILIPCWWSYSPLPAQQSSSIPAGAGSQRHPSQSSFHALLLTVGSHIHPCLPSGHTLNLLLAVTFTPAHPAVILYPSCWHSYSTLRKRRLSATPPAGGHIHPTKPSN